jgi:protein gp37
MGDNSSIEWTDATWNPTRGCSRVSPGCGGPNHQGGCYAEKIAARFSGAGQPFEGYAERGPHGGRWTGKLGLVDDMLTLPLRWKKPRRIFVNSMSDLFHEALPDETIDKVYAVMALARQHTFQVLTKRADRMREYAGGGWRQRVRSWLDKLKPSSLWNGNVVQAWGALNDGILPNVWLGVSVEDRARKDRIDDLKRTPAAVRFLSCEPLLENLGELELDGIDLVIVGGESGPRSRDFEIEAAQSIQQQCKNQGTAFFLKQLGAVPTLGRGVLKLKDRKGGDMSEWPEDLRVREFPT